MTVIIGIFYYLRGGGIEGCGLGLMSFVPSGCDWIAHRWLRWCGSGFHGWVDVLDHCMSNGFKSVANVIECGFLRELCFGDRYLSFVIGRCVGVSVLFGLEWFIKQELM
jgi:hypothetical protein